MNERSLERISKSTDFYPFNINRDNIPEFSLKDFRLGMHYFLKNDDHTAARQLIFIGEQNNVRGQLEPAEQKEYAKLFTKYDGAKIADDTNEYLENYTRLVRLIGKIVSEYRHRNFTAQPGGPVAFADRAGK